MEDKLVSMDGETVVIKKKISVDPNKDGEPLLELNVEARVHVMEIPDEAYDLYKKKKGN